MRVGIVMAAYNAELWIRQSIDAVLAQTYRNLNLIVVDDGSTDSTAEIITSYGSRITALRSDRKGPAFARNLGISASVDKTDFIAFCDADDIWLPEKLEIQTGHLHANQSSIGCHTDAIYIGPDGKYIRSVQSVPKYRTEDEQFLALLVGGNYICFSSLLFRTDVLRGERFDESNALIGAEDYDLLLRLSRCGRCSRVAIPLVCYRRYPGSLSSHNRNSYSSDRLIVDTLSHDQSPLTRACAIINLNLQFAKEFFIERDFVFLFFSLANTVLDLCRTIYDGLRWKK